MSATAKDCEPEHSARQCLSSDEGGLSAERQQIILDSLELVEQVSAQVGTASYLWGGMALDVYAGHLLRDHHDLDYLTINLHSRINEFVDAFTQVGCDTRVLVNGDLKVEGTGIDIHLGNIEINKQVRWVHDPNRTQGVLCFPQVWLSSKPYAFEEMIVNVVEPEFEYVVKSWPDLLNPSWVRRLQDDEALEQTQAILLERQVELLSLLGQVQIV